MFDIASQTINNSWRKSKQKYTKFYYNQDHISKPPSWLKFPLFYQHELLMSLRSWFYAPPSAPTCSRTQKLNFTIGKHFRDKYSLVPRDLTKNFSVIKKCTNEFDCLHYEMFFIQELRRALNVQSVSIRARFLILIKFFNFNF